jgi:hypothetical protein
MTHPSEWQRGNEEYLVAALNWLRLILLRNVSGDESTVEPINDQCVAEARTAMLSLEKTEPPPALVIATRQFGLSPFESDVLLLATAMELDTRIAHLCARVQDDPNKPFATFALAFSIFAEPSWDALSPGRPLRHFRLLEINQPGAQPLSVSAIRTDERMVSYFKGLNYLDDRLSPLLIPIAFNESEGSLPDSQQQVVNTIVRDLTQGTPAGHLPVINLLGSDRASKRLVASQAAAALNLHLYLLPAELLPGQAAELETMARLWQRESILLPLALYVDAHDLDRVTTGETSAPPINRFLTRSHGVFFLDTQDLWPNLSRPIVGIDVNKPTADEQQAAWTGALGQVAANNPQRLAGQFNLDLTSINQISLEVLTGPASDRDDLPGRLWSSCLARTRPQLDNLAQRLEPKASWDDIILPKAEKKLLRQIADQVDHRSRVYGDWGFARKMNRGLGISALFAGDSGTGKTMAAEVIASELGLNLYRIDLSAVVSKYIGETEKNLRRLFNAADDGGAILFFDEADALFGKRSEVKDSHDRYANIEINYLLQRMETYRGLAILATNMKNALDQAFMRRLRFIVDFPFPGIAERKAIWKDVFPPEVKKVNLDLDRLARLNLTGGNIHNVAINAAFLAARAEGVISMPLVLDAARSEFRKLGRPISESDFRWQEPAAVDLSKSTPVAAAESPRSAAEDVRGQVDDFSLVPIA